MVRDMCDKQGCLKVTHWDSRSSAYGTGAAVPEICGGHCDDNWSGHVR